MGENQNRHRFWYRHRVEMKKLIKGLREFKSDYFASHVDMFELLAHGQKPRVLFIACSDSRIVPSLITNTEPGELFVIRNAGNMIPPFGATNGGEGAAVEYAVQALGIEQIVVCGHSHCGAMKGLLALNKLQDNMPLVYDWLKQAEATRRLVRENYSEYEGEELLEITIAENVLTQIENLETYPVIRSRLYQGKMQIFGWVYYLETGEVLAYDPETHTYLAPQTQLASIEQEPTPGHYISTSAPVACDLILTTHHQEEPKTSNGQHKSTAQVPPHPSYTGSAPSQTQTNGHQPNNSVNEPALGAGWLSPEQAERIYRGRS
jgi:carbonic anhydrase